MEVIDNPEFISKSPFKTPRMIVEEYDGNDNMIKTFEAVEGFQLDRYASNLWSNDQSVIRLHFDKQNGKILGLSLTVEIAGTQVRRYIGRYI